MNKLILTAILIAAVAAIANAQIAQSSDGNYKLEQSVIASGTLSSGGAGDNYKVRSAIGEPVAGTTSSNSPYAVRGGFFTSSLFAPTAAGVSIEGTVRLASGKGIRNVVITLLDAGGLIRTTVSGEFGRYRFDEVEAGQTVILSASAKRFGFIKPVQILNLTEEPAEIDFIAIEQFVPTEIIPKR